MTFRYTTSNRVTFPLNQYTSTDPMPSSPRKTNASESITDSEAFEGGSGSDLLSHTVTHAVPSAQEGLTSEFGMGSGVALLQ